MDKSERRNHHPAAKPSDLDQFGAQMGGDKIAPNADKPKAENNRN